MEGIPLDIPPTPWRAIRVAGIWRVEDADGGTVGESMYERVAPLLASGPELLAALKGLLDDYVAGTHRGGQEVLDPEEVPEVIAARAAIAKAEASIAGP